MVECFAGVHALRSKRKDIKEGLNYKKVITRLHGFEVILCLGIVHRIEKFCDARMDGRAYENYYTTQQRRMQGPLARPISSYLQGFDGEHIVVSIISGLILYGAGYIIARLFYSGIMFFLAVGLILFFIMQIVDGVDSSVKAARYNRDY